MEFPDPYASLRDRKLVVRPIALFPCSYACVRKPNSLSSLASGFASLLIRSLVWEDRNLVASHRFAFKMWPILSSDNHGFISSI
jgi:hypothetical protein